MKWKNRKKDLLVLVILAAAIIGVWLGFRAGSRGTASMVRVTVDGKEFGSYSLSEDGEIPISNGNKVTNTLVIKDGKADMIEADCPDKLCVHQKAISAKGEMIVCLPNKVVAEVVSSEEEAGFDTIAK